MKNAKILGKPGALFRLLLCVLLVWGLAPLSAFADTRSSDGSVEHEEVSAQSGPEVPDAADGAEAEAQGDDVSGDAREPLGDDPLNADETAVADTAETLDDSEPAEAPDSIEFAAVSDYTSLANAVAAASPGATVEIAGSFDFVDTISIDKPLTISSTDGATLTAASGKRHFSVDGAAISGGQGVVFEGLSLQGPLSIMPSAENGGIFATNMASATLTISNCSFTGNEITGTVGGGNGGALSVATSSLGVTVTDCTFIGNAAFVDGGAASTKNSPATYERCIFRENTARSHGGAVASASNAKLIDCLFEGNEAGSNGGGATFSYNNTNPVIVQGTTFANNTAGNSGGGLHVLNFVFSGVPDCVVENSTFVGNEVTNPSAVGRTYIGGAALIDAQATVRNVTAIGNSAPDSATGAGAGIVLFSEGFGGAYNHTVEGCLAVANYQDGAESNIGMITGPAMGAGTYGAYSAAAASLTAIPAGSSLADIVAVNSLGATLLADNGGPVSTVALNPDGPAVDAYEAADVTLSPLGTDQRGKARPAGVGYDFGAFELQDNERSREIAIARLFGADRYATSHKVCTHTRSSCGVVILASGEDGRFPDALAASALSGAEGNAPIVLTPTDWLCGNAREAIETDLQPSRVIIVGDPNAISMDVENEVRSILGPAGTVERIGGIDRQDTADKIYQAYADEFSKTAIIALATDFPDALSASSWAAKTKSPIFLAHFGSRGLSESTLQSLSDGGFERILVMGSSLSVSDEVVQQALAAAGLGYGDYVRFNGIDRYDTSAKFAAWAMSEDRDASEQLTMHGAAIVRGDKHSDSLTGGALQGRDSAVVLLTHRDSITPTVENLLDAHLDEIGELRFFGDEYAVELDVVRHYIQKVPYTSILWLPDDSVAIC